MNVENSYCSAYSSLFNFLKPKTNKRTYKSFEENTGKEEETSCTICDITHYFSCKKKIFLRVTVSEQYL